MNDARCETDGSAREWASLLNCYRDPSPGRSAVELALTIGAFALVWILMWATLGFGYGFTLPLALPAAGFLLRLFMIQHDCGHGAFFRKRSSNDWVGRFLGTLTLTPYDVWRQSHNIHHASSGNLDKRGIGDIDTLTVREYTALPIWRRLRYRLYRHPLVMFGLGPAYLFLVRHRFPVGSMRKGWQPWISTMVTNAATAVLVTALIWLIGVGPFLLVHLPITLLAASIGVWLFYVQHQYEETYWHRQKEWDFFDAALQGSSYLVLPRPLQWLTANIGLHHVHHLSSRIPNYRLEEAMEAHPELQRVTRVTLVESIRLATLSLWDEEAARLIRFRDLRGRAAQAA